MNEPIERRVKLDDVNLTYFEWGKRENCTVLFIHATGFHARCWDQVIRLLDVHGHAWHAISLDMRGHGRSDKTPPFSWDSFGKDVINFIKALQLDQIIGVGHSMGGHCVVQAAAAEPDRFRHLLLIDPVILAPEMYAATAEQQATLEGEHPVARRKNQFDNADAMFANFENRDSFAVWDRQVLRDYCQHGILPNPHGPGFVLACPPHVEAQIYMGSSRHDIHDLIKAVETPVLILRAAVREGERMQMDFSASPTWPDLATSFPKGEDCYLPELTHFIPMQSPQLVADQIASLASLGAR